MECSWNSPSDLCVWTGDRAGRGGTSDVLLPLADEECKEASFLKNPISDIRARTASGIFTDDVSFLVALATPDEIILLVVAFDGSNQLQLWESPYYLPSDNVSMHAIAATDTGRIFMGGSDGCLYEFVYQVG